MKKYFILFSSFVQCVRFAWLSVMIGILKNAEDIPVLKKKKPSYPVQNCLEVEACWGCSGKLEEEP